MEAQHPEPQVFINTITEELHVQEGIKNIIRYIGDDPNREGLIDTPERITKSYVELFSGYNEDPHDLLKSFEDGSCEEMVVLKDIQFFSTCEHHFLPFFGSVSLGYLPSSRVIGVSKLARFVNLFARRLQIQERFVADIADALMEGLKPKGVIVMAKAVHLCMVARGVKQPGSSMITSALRGVFLTNNACKQEFLQLIQI